MFHFIGTSLPSLEHYFSVNTDQFLRIMKKPELHHYRRCRKQKVQKRKSKLFNERKGTTQAAERLLHDTVLKTRARLIAH